VAGGCPLLNMAVESDDSNPALRVHAQKGMRLLERFIGGLLADAQERGQTRPGLDLEAAVRFLIAALEGGVMLSRLYGEVAQMRAVVEGLKMYVDQSIRV